MDVAQLETTSKPVPQESPEGFILKVHPEGDTGRWSQGIPEHQAYEARTSSVSANHPEHGIAWLSFLPHNSPTISSKSKPDIL